MQSIKQEGILHLFEKD